MIELRYYSTAFDIPVRLQMRQQLVVGEGIDFFNIPWRKLEWTEWADVPSLIEISE